MNPLNNEPRFDKNYIAAFAFTLIILLGYPFLMKKFYPENYSRPEKTQPAAVSSEAAVVTAGAEKVSTPAEALEKFAAPAVVLYENPFYQAQFSTLGATLTAFHYNGEARKHGVIETVFIDALPGQPGLFGLKILNEPEDFSSQVFKLNKKSVI